MDYEKKYKEALERAKVWAAGTWGHSVDDSPKEIAEYIFPELAESEDERIRKMCITAVNIAASADGGLLHHEAKQCLDWLEKQKDLDKMIVVSPEVWDNAISDAFENGKKEGEKQKEQSTKHKTYDGKALSRSYDLGYRKGVADAEKEMYNESGYTPDESRAYDHGYENGYNDGKDEVKQKPAELETLGKPMTHEEWAEDYWEHHKFASPNGNDKCDVIQFGHKGFIDFCMAYCVDQKPQDRLVLHDTFGYEKGRQVGQREGVEMVLKTPESYGLYKPAEWSEEDEEIRQSIIKDIEFERNFTSATTGKVIGKYDEKINWLKSLRPQPKQEWREEDSKRYISIGTTLETSVVLSKEDYDANMAWLRELVNAKKYSGSMPSWKPSEEQMKAIKHAYNSFPNYCPSKLELKSLYEQLKKL